MSTYDFNKIRESYNILAGINKVCEDATKKDDTIETSGIVSEYESFLQETERILPGLLKPFDKNDFISAYYGVNDVYYRVNGIKMNIARNLGILKTKMAESENTPVTQTKSFHFVSDINIRKILERDYQEIQRNMISLNWKSSIILCGGSIEAILLDLLMKNSTKACASPKAPKENDLNRWDLNDLVEVAVEEKAIGSEIAKLSHTVREYRNLIHPGVEVRKSLKVESEEAKIAVEVLHILIRELS
ncbi:MAG: hypothetical protein GYA14_01895 [Ignavibacteria bacterium]|nr:hypothetical protein [Ignavibacteria bacterium]